MKAALRLSVWVALLAGACGSQPELGLDQATVIVTNTSVRAEPASSSRTLFRLGEGERVTILEKSGTWYRVLDRDDFEGWMDESTLLRDSTEARMQEMLGESRDAPVQNIVVSREEVNLRLEPGRDTTIIRRLRRDQVFEVLDRATTPRPDSEATDVWLKVRLGADEIGWVYRPLVEFQTPVELQPFTEGRTYTAAQVLDEVDDPITGPVRWYVVAERRGEASPGVAFDGIRVFTWNLTEHRYETSLRLRDLDGAYPVETLATEPPGFRFHEIDPDAGVRARQFVMRGTVPREVPVD